MPDRGAWDYALMYVLGVATGFMWCLWANAPDDADAEDFATDDARHDWRSGEDDS